MGIVKIIITYTKNMKIVISFLTFVLTSALVAIEPPTTNLGKEAPTQAKPIVTGAPPKPPASLTDELGKNKLIDYKKLSEELELKNKNLTTTNATLVSTNQELSEQNTKLASEKSKTTEQLSVVTTERNNLASELQNANNRVSTLSNSNNELTVMVNSLSSQVDNVGSIFNGWVYYPEFGWAFMSPNTMPYFYISELGWVYYELGSSPRRFYFFEDERWEIMED